MESDRTCPFVSDFCHSVPRPQGSSTLQPVLDLKTDVILGLVNLPPS